MSNTRHLFAKSRGFRVKLSQKTHEITHHDIRHRNIPVLCGKRRGEPGEIVLKAEA